MPTFLVSLRDVIQANGGMARIAETTGLSRESLYKALSATGNPHLSTIRKIMQALGYDFGLVNQFSALSKDVALAETYI